MVVLVKGPPAAPTALATPEACKSDRRCRCANFPALELAGGVVYYPPLDVRVEVPPQEPTSVELNPQFQNHVKNQTGGW